MDKIFDIYFASVVSMNLHPGTTRDPPREMTLEQCAEYAWRMVEVRNNLLQQAGIIT